MCAKVGQFFDNAGELIKRIFWPRLCVFCRCAISPKGSDICGDCEEDLKTIRLTGARRNVLRLAQQNINRIDLAVASYSYTGCARSCIVRYKRNKQYFKAPRLAMDMAEDIRDYPFHRQIELVAAVPAYGVGGEHALWLARAVADELQLPFSEEALIKIRKTAPQHRLSSKRRLKNLSGSFRASGVKGKEVLVVDDVITTGATLNACASALKAAGAKRVYTLTFCSTY